MKVAKTSVVAFDGRYINDRYHGIGRYAYNLLEALTRCDTQRCYLVFFNPTYVNSRFSLEKLATRPNVVVHPLRLPLYQPGEQLIWPFLLARNRVDIFHTPYVVLPWLAPVRSIMTIHDLIFERYPEYRPRSPLQKFYLPVTQLSLKRADLVFTLSKATRSEVRAYYRTDQTAIHVTGGAIDPHFRRESDPQRLADVRARYALPERFILTVGAGRPHKNVATLVEAFKHLDPSLHVSLVIGGEHDARFPDLVETCVKNSGVAHLVKRPGLIREADLPAIYSLAELFVFPSLVEGFGLPPLEAMACGTPVIASAIPVVSEMLGEAALTFDAQEPRELAQLLTRALNDSALREALSRRGTERVQTFTWEQVARETLKAYASIEARPGGFCSLAKRAFGRRGEG